MGKIVPQAIEFGDEITDETEEVIRIQHGRFDPFCGGLRGAGRSAKEERGFCLTSMIFTSSSRRIKVGRVKEEKRLGCFGRRDGKGYGIGFLIAVVGKEEERVGEEK